MTITRETLELAAKAAGIAVQRDVSATGREIVSIPYDNANMMTAIEWSPLTDHGQLLDVAMACSMVIDNENGQVLCYCERKGWQRYQSCPGDFHSLAEAIITAAAEQQLAKEAS